MSTHDGYTVKMGIREIPPTGIRIPEDLKKQLVEVARANGRSLNAEVLARLRGSFDKPKTLQGVAESDPQTYYVPQEISEIEKRFLTLFRRWGPEKQLAFLALRINVCNP